MPELQQEMPFFESAENATYSAIIASRKPIKEVAHALWPSMKMDSAYARLKGALSDERPEKLSADEHLFIANFCKQFHFLYYVENQCHHSGTQLITPEDEEANLMRTFNKQVDNLLMMANQIKAVRGRA